MTAEEARNKSHWNALPSYITESIVRAIRNGFTSTKWNEGSSERENSAILYHLQELGYNVTCVESRIYEIEW